MQASRGTCVRDALFSIPGGGFVWRRRRWGQREKEQEPAGRDNDRDAGRQEWWRVKESIGWSGGVSIR